MKARERVFSDISGMVGGLMHSADGFKKEIFSSLEVQFQKFCDKMGYVTREEYDILCKRLEVIESELKNSAKPAKKSTKKKKD